ncbi:M23 family metallopeptidase [Pseudarthrobacter sp. NPDC092439]|uniref:M23 family metallopeptidase n=1 Tax=unclassified Pseudarthrobacter TaxID=2647000 RepID=UPI00382B55C5
MKTMGLLAALLFLPASSAAGSVPAPAGTGPAWQWPLQPRPPVLRNFDPPPQPWLSGHRGVDLGAAGDGVKVTSPADGTISFVGTVVDRPVLTVDHGNGLRSSFEPVESTLAKGTSVQAGQAVGILRNGHCGTRPCVHWGVRQDGDYVNPLKFVMDLRPSVLLPLYAGEPDQQDGGIKAGTSRDNAPRQVRRWPRSR